MDLSRLTPETGSREPLKAVEEIHWSHQFAAITLIAGAVLLVCGRKRQALAIAAAGAAGTILERPQAAQELWAALPGHIRTGQDFLVRAEGFIERLGEQAAKLREVMSKQAGL